MKSKVMDAYRELVRSGELLAAWLVLDLLKHGKVSLGLGDNAFKVECILGKLGCRIWYSRNYNIATVYLPKEPPATKPETSQQEQPAISKDRRKLSALMRRLDDFGKDTALKIYCEGREYDCKVLEGFEGVTERDRIEAYLSETWTYDELYDLCRAFKVKPRGYRDFSFDFDWELIDPLLEIITLVGARLDIEDIPETEQRRP